MPSEAAEWSRPRLVEVNRGQHLPAEPLDAEPEPPTEPEPAPETQPEPEVESTVVDPEPQFTSVPIEPPRTRLAFPAGEIPSWHGKLVQQVAEVAVVAMPIPLRVLDVGCGDAALLAELILRIPYAELYVALDPRPDAVPADLRATEPRLSVVRGAAEALPLPDASFDLVIASLSLTLWADERAGAAELSRVVSDNGKVIVVELRKAQLTGRNRVSGVKEISALLEAQGLDVERVETVHRSPLGAPLAHAFIASP